MGEFIGGGGVLIIATNTDDIIVVYIIVVVIADSRLFIVISLAFILLERADRLLP